jgi:hypothetical protein
MTFQKSTDGKLRLNFTLPVPMPTWNVVMRLHWTKWKRVNDLLHLFVKESITNAMTKQYPTRDSLGQYVSTSITYESVSPTSIIFAQKLRSMDSLRAEYLKMIGRSSSKKSGTPRKRVAKKEQK